MNYFTTPKCTDPHLTLAINQRGSPSCNNFPYRRESDAIVMAIDCSPFHISTLPYVTFHILLRTNSKESG